MTVYVRTAAGRMWHLADSRRARHCFCGIVFAEPVDRVVEEIGDAARCSSCAAAAVRRERRHAGVEALERMPASETHSAAIAVAVLAEVGAGDDDADLDYGDAADVLDDDIDGDDWADDDELELSTKPKPKPARRRRTTGTATALGGDVVIENGQKRWRPTWA